MAGGVQEYLQQLHGCLQPGDAMCGYGLLRGLGEACLTCSAGGALALHVSLVFAPERGLLAFVCRSLGVEEFRECREEALKFLCVFLEKIGERVHPYACSLKQTCISVYTKERAAKCKIPALELLIKLLQSLRRSCLMEEMKVGEIFNKFYGELAVKSKVSDTVLEKIYELLGVLGEVHPTDMINNSEKLFRAYLGELKTQMTSATRVPKLPLVAGCLRGLTALMYNFTKSVDEDAQTSKEIFDFAVKAIRPQVDQKRYAVHLAGLQLFSWHAAQFGTLLLDSYVMLFETMCRWCGHTNQELKKAGHNALDSFLKQMSLMVAKDAELHKSKLKFFMEEFYGIIRRMDSSNKELSIAIRGYGLFAAPCKAIHPADVDAMYVELLQRCKQMYLTEAETMDDHLYQLPSFLQSIASVIFHLDTIPEVYTPVLEHLVVLQINSFPRYSEKMQLTCCRSIIKVFLALSIKGPVLWSFISTVVHQGLIRVFSKPMKFSKDVFGKETSGSEDFPEAGEVETAKWKVPTYKDYLYLFRSLLSCDTMKESIFEEKNFLTGNSPLQSLNRLLYDELIKSILKIIEKLDLTVQKLNVHEQDENEPDNAFIGPASDPASNLQPKKPTDFIAFINLVEFCRDILPDKHVEYFQPWVYSFGYELIVHSTRLPLISGFYKLLSVTMKIAKKIKYFEGVSPKSLRRATEDPEKSSCFALFAKFGKEVTAKMKQYKDELLASCLNFLLSLPHDIIMLDIKAYIPALQNAFKLGLSCTPMADLGLDALEDWSAHIPRHIMQPYYKDVLPLLDGYLKNSATTVEPQNNWEVRKLSRAAQKGFNKIVIQRLRKARTSSLDDNPCLEAVRTRVARLLGSLGGQINHNLITATSAEEMMKKCVSWDTENHLSFAVPFADMKPVIYLDVFLPRVTDLALSASDRQTKVAACELLHSIVAYMLGKASQMPERQQGPPPMYQLYKRIFPVLLRLACDVDQDQADPGAAETLKAGRESDCCSSKSSYLEDHGLLLPEQLVSSWRQKLLLKSADIPVIMNTYFCQKVLLSEHLETSKTQGPTNVLIRKNIVSLAQTFKLDDLDNKQPQQSPDNQVACAPQIHNNSDPKKHPLAPSAVNDSLLEMVESQGAVGWREVQVRVVIQRVYYLPAREGFRSQIQGNKPICATPIINSDPLNVRLCLLVQDAYGMFSEVLLHCLDSAEDIEQYCKRWEGKFCCLAGMKILQRTTRGRALGLFSLIDSLWPPVAPVKVPGQSQDSEMMTTNLPPPSFCYVLAVQSGEIHMEVDEEERISNLYQPPTVRNLKEILQMSGCNERCSFWARVLYLRSQTKHSVPVNQREMLLFVTDFTLQSVVCGVPKVVAVSVTASCVLSMEIIEALSVASRFIFFKDALWGNGRIICVERTVLLLQKPLLCSAADADLSELPGPVKLDELDSTTQANSICAVRGTVVGVNESTAFSWPTCDRCGNGKLELYPQDSGLLYCNQCSEVVISPVLKMQLEVFLSCPSQSQSTVKVKLLQRTISSLLTSAANEDGSYEASGVLGKELGPLPCLLLLGAGGQPGCARLEEVALLPAGPGEASD